MTWNLWSYNVNSVDYIFSNTFVNSLKSGYQMLLTVVFIQIYIWSCYITDTCILFRYTMNMEKNKLRKNHKRAVIIYVYCIYWYTYILIYKQNVNMITKCWESPPSVGWGELCVLHHCKNKYVLQGGWVELWVVGVARWVGG